MSSGAKRLVQSLRGRSGGRGAGGGRSDAGAGDDSGVGVGGGASTSATRLFHYDSGHELDEISVIGATVRSEGLTTPTTPCHCRSIKYGSGQTLCSIAGLPAPASSTHRAQSGEYDCYLFNVLDRRQSPRLLTATDELCFKNASRAVSQDTRTFQQFDYTDTKYSNCKINFSFRTGILFSSNAFPLYFIFF